MSTTTTRLQPPANEQPVQTDGTQHTQAWAAFHQDVADQLATQAAQITTLQQTVGASKHGVTDGSDAAAGDIGEYLAASGASIALVNLAATALVSITLTAGDWDVSGSATFAAGSGTHLSFGAGINGIEVQNQATFPSTSITQAMVTGVNRYSLTTTMTVSTMAQAQFTGSVTASGTIRARRVR